jgi:hypothetical protein
MRIALATGLTILLLVALPPPVAARDHRLPKGSHWGRCLLVVGDRTLISGRCGYETYEAGEFSIEGPRQGDDEPKAQQSRDYWAYVYKDADGTWQGHTNADDIRATHGDVVFRSLTAEGACLVGETDAGQTATGERLPGEPVKVCLWRQ